jgi:hypothetical protein
MKSQKWTVIRVIRDNALARDYALNEHGRLQERPPANPRRRNPCSGDNSLSGKGSRIAKLQFEPSELTAPPVALDSDNADSQLGQITSGTGFDQQAQLFGFDCDALMGDSFESWEFSNVDLDDVEESRDPLDSCAPVRAFRARL